MRVLVTGATGFIGKEIVSELLKNDFEVIGIGSLKSSETRESLPNESEFYFTDITKPESLIDLEIVGKVDVVIHSAGLAHQFGETEKEAFDAVNVEGTKNVAKLAVKLEAKHFILISSTAVYGIKTPTDNASKNKIVNAFDENTEPNPQTLYARSKLEAEQSCREICERNKLPLTIFRLAPVIGEANVGNVARLIKSIDKGQFLWIGKGENLKSLIYKNDVARACVELIKKKIGATEIFNLAAQPIKMKDFVNEIAGFLEKKIYKIYVPKELLQIIFRLNSVSLRNKKVAKLKDTVEKWLSDDVYEANKIAEKYGFEPQTSISEAIKKQISWSKS